MHLRIHKAWRPRYSSVALPNPAGHNSVTRDLDAVPMDMRRKHHLPTTPLTPGRRPPRNQGNHEARRRRHPAPTISGVLNGAEALTIAVAAYTVASRLRHGQAVLQNRDEVVCAIRFGDDPTRAENQLGYAALAALDSLTVDPK